MDTKTDEATSRRIRGLRALDAFLDLSGHEIDASELVRLVDGGYPDLYVAALAQAGMAVAADDILAAFEGLGGSAIVAAVGFDNVRAAGLAVGGDVEDCLRAALARELSAAPFTRPDLQAA